MATEGCECWGQRGRPHEAGSDWQQHLPGSSHPYRGAWQLWQRLQEGGNVVLIVQALILVSKLSLMVLNSQLSQWALTPRVQEASRHFSPFEFSFSAPSLWRSTCLLVLDMLRGVRLKGVVRDGKGFLMLLNFFRYIYCFPEVWYRDVSLQV